MGRTRPKSMGWAEPGPPTWVGLVLPAHYSGPLHYSHATWSVERQTQKEKKEVEEEREEGWPVVASRRCWWWRRHCCRSGGRSSIISFFFLSLLSFFSFFFFPFSSRFPCSFSPILFVLSLLSLLFFFFSFLFFFVLPCFYRRKQGRHMVEAATVLSPLQHVESGWRLFGRSRCLFGWSRWRWQRKKKTSSSPASHVQGKKKTHSAVQNGIVSASLLFYFFDERYMKRCCFI